MDELVDPALKLLTADLEQLYNLKIRQDRRIVVIIVGAIAGTVLAFFLGTCYK